MTCINKSNKNYKLAKARYGASFAESVIRNISKSKGLIDDFYYPTIQEIKDYYKGEIKKKETLIFDALKNNTNLTLKTITDLLQGVIHKHNGIYFVTQGFGNNQSFIIKADNYTMIYRPNLEIIKKLEEMYPDIFSRTYVVKYTPPGASSSLSFVVENLNLKGREKIFDDYDLEVFKTPSKERNTILKIARIYRDVPLSINRPFVTRLTINPKLILTPVKEEVETEESLLNENLRTLGFRERQTEIIQKEGQFISSTGNIYSSLQEALIDKDGKFEEKSQLTQPIKPGVSELPTFYQNNTNQSTEEYIASEKTIRDLAARISDRIGISVQFESDRTKQYKGKLENGTAIVNLAYATLDTPIHEILGHPIIRAIKNKQSVTKRFVANFNKRFFDNQDEKINTGKTIEHEGHIYNVYKLKKYSNVEYRAYNFQRNEQIELSEEEFKDIINYSQLYQNLLKELEYGKGKEVLDRIKRDYEYKGSKVNDDFQVYEKNGKYYFYDSLASYSGEDGEIEITKEKYEEILKGDKYTLEEQQEEAIVELLGLYTAGRLDKVKDGKLISLLKRLLKEMKAFMKQLLGQKEVKIDELPDNMTIGDLADLLAYSNSKLILPGNDVIYTTPDNQQFKTYAEASKHISELAKNVKDVNLDNIDLQDVNLNEIDYFENSHYNEEYNVLVHGKFKKENNEWFVSWDDAPFEKIEKQYVLRNYREKSGKGLIENFIEKNKEYEQSKEIIEEWKKVNNIRYNPEEIYSRGQEFTSVVGAYSDFDVNLMMQNLLQHIEDNEKAGGEFTISAFTKPVDRTIGHLEGGGGKIKFKIYPKSKDIKWAANTDVYSGSVWDASEKVSKDKKSELLGVSYSKYPSLRNINAVQPNLASIVDSLAHHHNELGITLTGNNFRLEYDEDIPYSTKKIINSINSILDQKYGKLVKPEINLSGKSKKTFVVTNWDTADIAGVETKEFNSLKEAEDFIQSEKIKYNLLNTNSYQIDEKYTKQGIQPTQTNETLKENIDSVKNKIITPKLGNWRIIPGPGGKGMEWAVEYILEGGGGDLDFFNTEKEAKDFINSFLEAKGKDKEYTSQALINTKIAKLKEVAKKYPRNLIRSEVKPIFGAFVGNNFIPFDKDDLPFQKIPSVVKPGVAELFESNPELANSVYEAAGFTPVTSKLTKKGESLLNTTFNKIENQKQIIYANYLADGESALKNILDTIARLHIYENYQSQNRLNQLGKQENPKTDLQNEIKKRLDKGETIEFIYNSKIVEIENKLKELEEQYIKFIDNDTNIAYLFAESLLGQKPEEEIIELINYYQKLLNIFKKEGVEYFESLIEKNYSIYGDVSEEIENLLQNEKLYNYSNFYRNKLNSQIKEIKENFFIGELSKKGNPTNRNIFDRLSSDFIEDFIIEGQESITVQFLKDLSNETSINSKTQNLVRELERRLDILKNKKNGHYLMTVLNLKQYNDKNQTVNITPQQKQQAILLYSQYLDTIFPDSKVKDIVYHGTRTKEEFEKFITEREYPIQLPQFKGKISKGSFFTKDKNIADVAGIRTITAILNMENPLYRNKGSEYLFKEDVEDIQKNNDSLIAPGNKEEFIVFEPEQIHILSSKADIQGFKNFMSFENSEFSKYGTYQQFRDFITSKSSIEIENKLIETGKIDRAC